MGEGVLVGRSWCTCKKTAVLSGAYGTAGNPDEQMQKRQHLILNLANADTPRLPLPAGQPIHQIPFTPKVATGKGKSRSHPNS